MKTKYLLSTLALSAAFVACNNEELVVNETPKFDGNEVVGARLLGEGLSLNITTNSEGEDTRATASGWVSGDVAGLGWVVAGSPTDYQTKKGLSEVGETLYANHFYQYDGASWGAKTNIYEGWHFAYFPYVHHAKPGNLAFEVNGAVFATENAEKDYAFNADIINNSPHISAAAKLTLDNINEMEGTIEERFSVERIVNVLSPKLNISSEFTEDALLQTLDIKSITLSTPGYNFFYKNIRIIPSKLPQNLYKENGEYDAAETVKQLGKSLYTTGAVDGYTNTAYITTNLKDGMFKLNQPSHLLRMFLAPVLEKSTEKNVFKLRVDVAGGHFDIAYTVAEEGKELSDVQKTNNAAIEKLFNLISKKGEGYNGVHFKNIADEKGNVYSAQGLNVALAIENFTADYFIDEEGEWDACVDLANALGATNPTFTVAKDFAVEFGDAEVMNAPTGGVTVVAEDGGTAILKVTGKTAWNSTITVGTGMSVEVSAEGELSVEGEELKSVTLVNNGDIVAGELATVGSKGGNNFTNNGRVTIEYGAYVYPASGAVGEIAYELLPADGVKVVNTLVAGGTNDERANVNVLIVKDRAWDLDATLGDNTTGGGRYDITETMPGDGYNFDALKNVSVEIENAQVSSAKKQATFANVTMTGATSSLTGVSVTGALNVTDKGAVDCVELNTVTSDGDVKAEIIKNNVTAANVEVATSIIGNVTATGNVTAKSITGDVLSAVNVTVADGAINGNVTATGNVTAKSISKTLNVNGNGTVTVETIEGAVTLNGKPTVVGAVINDNVTVVGGEATFNNVTINGTLTVKSGAKATFNSEESINITEIKNNGGTLISNNDIIVDNVTLENKSVTTLGADWNKTIWYKGTYVHNNSQLNGYVKKSPASSEELQAVLDAAVAGSTIVLSDADCGSVTVGELKDVTIVGSENSVMIFKTTADTKIENVKLQNVNFEYTGTTANCGIVVDANAQIDNLVVEGCTFTGTGAKAGRGISGLNSNATIVLKECTFKDLGYPIYAWGGYESLTVEGCTFENIKSWAIMPQSGFDGDLTVTGCIFKDCLGGGLIKAGTLTAGHTFTFTNNTITGCTIAGDHNWFQFNASAGTSVISGNKKDGQPWTPSTAEGLLKQ